MPSYLALARRYRPQSLTVTGRVYEPTYQHPYWVHLRPFHGSFTVEVESSVSKLSQSVKAEDLDDPILLEVADQLFIKLKIAESQACSPAS